MPVYEYVCDDCNARFERRVAHPDEGAEVSCRECESDHVRRAISRVAFIGTNGALPMSSTSDGGCCGGACGCHGHA